MPTSGRTLKLGRNLTRKDRTQPTRGGGGGPSAFLLQNASWYVDARSYSGTGNLLDLTGNANHAVPGATTAAPTWLPYTGSKYVYLPGSAGNTISCTAPSGTASFAAYPLGGGGATTGAAAPGAFAFQTGGSWLRIELLDGASAVLASFLASSVPSPYTGHTDSFGVAWTVNRAATGLKTAVVDRPMFLLGTDDYFEVADNDLLDFNSFQAFTVIAVYRNQANLASANVIAKRTSDTTAGWNIRHGGTATTHVGLWGDGTSNSTATLAAAATAGPTTFAILRRDAAGSGVIGNATSFGTPVVGNSDARNAEVLRIGRLSGASTAYDDMEFLAAAIIRRDLSTTEIAQVVAELS